MPTDDFNNLLTRIGENIHRLRKLNHWTQSELAEQTGRPQSSIARVEGATYTDATLSLLHDLCSTFEVPLSEMIRNAEGGRLKSTGKLQTKWQRVRARVDKLGESDRDWVADVVLAVLREKDGH